ncbi:MarR family winged helix-turn-helix transcriptional regulator [Fredinandcohnia sp. QZ13]|uniref:MarR family winged helix-turn-helix transcriptional regulator n=1 Tax=Fredinandcohnia sp. QZ13 TaxID=3073144 RepID=UPI00285322E1|nr:MarR family winged helix-turn-helix transcriptional regulator [Fredinandcohnia sp. QZ13]MDR4887260.1 MarR family winged helix-turn-helix transcriptional regulator [Fredinandcohnia sp. QZ13]
MQTGHELFHAVHQLSRQLTKHVNETLEPFGLFSAQWSVLFVLKTKGTSTQSELCDYLTVEAPPMTRNIQKLVKLGYVRQIQGIDKRTKQIELTEKALTEFPEWEQAMIEMNERLVNNFPKELQDQLRELLNQWFHQITK